MADLFENPMGLDGFEFVEYAAAERGDWSVVSNLSAAERKSLASYPLWPDLRATFFRATIRKADRTELEEFLDQRRSSKRFGV